MDKLILKSMHNSKAKQTNKQTHKQKTKLTKEKRGEILCYLNTQLNFLLS